MEVTENAPGKAEGGGGGAAAATVVGVVGVEVEAEAEGGEEQRDLIVAKGAVGRRMT